MTSTYWMSFVDPHRPEGERFLGVCLIDADSIYEALAQTHSYGCNPGGEVSITEIPSLDAVVSPDPRVRLAFEEAPRGLLFSKEELMERGLISDDR